MGVVSEEGDGATFRFTAQLKKKETQTLLAGSEELASLRILVVDDHQTRREVLEHWLSHWGCSVETAADGESIWQKIHHAATEGRGFDLVLVDMHMPDNNGWELAQDIKSDPQTLTYT